MLVYRITLGSHCTKRWRREKRSYRFRIPSQCPGTEALGPNAPGRIHWVPMPRDGDGDSVLSRAPSFGWDIKTLDPEYKTRRHFQAFFKGKNIVLYSDQYGTSTISASTTTFRFFYYFSYYYNLNYFYYFSFYYYFNYFYYFQILLLFQLLLLLSDSSTISASTTISTSSTTFRFFYYFSFYYYFQILQINSFYIYALQLSFSFQHSHAFSAGNACSS